jgi:hypothetical protein
MGETIPAVTALHFYFLNFRGKLAVVFSGHGDYLLLKVLA